MPPCLHEPGYKLDVQLDADLLAVARYDDRGVPCVGRSAELAALRIAGARDLSAARILEGHLNGIALVMRCGTDAQRERARRDASTGRLFGVWNTQDDDGVQLSREGDRVCLRGAKTWASGAGFVTRPIVTARVDGGASQMIIVPLDEVSADVDGSAWRPLGMQASQSLRVSFDGVKLDADSLVGEPSAYERDPWFSGGAIRFVAVQSGALQRLVDETIDYLIMRAREGDAIQTGRIAEMRVATETAALWVDRGGAAWTAFDANPRDRTACDAVDVADMARVAVERAAFDVLQHTMKAVGARGLVEPFPFAGIVRDLEMYLRQPAPDAILHRIGRTAIEAARRARIAGSAISTATGA